MTGEMHQSEVTAEAFPIHFAIAKAFRGAEVRAFDQYQGPYIRVPATTTRPAGKLWLQVKGEGPGFQIYNEANDKLSPVTYQSETALILEYARRVLTGPRVQKHKFNVTISETRVYDFTIEAESEDAAREIAMSGELDFNDDCNRSESTDCEVLAVEAV